MSPSGPSEAFVLEMVSCQNRLHVYILSLVVDKQQAMDILQQTNLVMLKKAADFQPGTNFGAWACRIAHYEVLAERRRKSRDRMLFDDEVLNLLAEDARGQLKDIDERAVALDECLKQMTSDQRRTLIERYSPNGSVQGMAEAMGRTPNAVSLTLHRLRTALADCIRRRLAANASSAPTQ